VPRRVPTFRPAWLAKPPQTRATAAQRGYGSKAWQRVRKLVISRDGGMCRACGILIHRAGEAHVDHIEEKPQSQAAEATPLEGLQLLCRQCHAKKTTRFAAGG
jgi:5-methylcytosine-specific restriction endonuclease McrA